MPRVGGGVSKFKRKGPSETTEPEKSPSNRPKVARNDVKKPSPHNRFKEQFSQQSRAPQRLSSSDRNAQYNEMRAALREKEKQREKPASGPAKPSSQPKKAPKSEQKISIQIPTFVTVSNLATIMNVQLGDLLKKLAVLGFEGMSHNYILDKENASLIADEYGFEINMNDETGLDLFPAPEEASKLKPRAPVVTIMGHVDHGKTTILDYLRKSSIVDQEQGGITQHIGAFSVVTPISKKQITFLDTPGHAAFLKMRERGAIITDIVILVVAADDSVMPQTVEAIKHAKKSGVPIIVAINKCDKQGLNTDKVLSDLARYEVDVEDYGGETQTVNVSGKTGLNMDKLEEAVITLSELSEYRAEVSGIAAEGWVIESQVVKGMGNVATVLVRRGTVKVGSFLVAGETYCKVRGMRDENGRAMKSAGPSVPVQIWGWKELPGAGDQILEAKNELVARKVVDNRITRGKQIQAGKDIENINSRRQEEVQELRRQEKINEMKLAGLSVDELTANDGDKICVAVKYIVKADVFGLAEAITSSIDGLGNDEVKAVVVLRDAGMPTDLDVDKAEALGAKILCFNVKTPKSTQSRADRAGVDVTEHSVIYRLIEQVTEELTSRLKPRIELKVVAEAEVKDVFQITGKNKSKSKIAGCKVLTGNLKRSARVRVVRGSETIFDGLLSSLKHVKEDISEAKKGTECGLAMDSWDKFAAGDKVEAYEEVLHARFL